MVVAELESVQLAWFFIAAVVVQPARFCWNSALCYSLMLPGFIGGLPNTV